MSLLAVLECAQNEYAHYHRGKGESDKLRNFFLFCATQPSTPSKKKKRRSTIPISTTQVLALGLHDGSVAIYSLSQGSVVKTLSGSHTMPVSDFVFIADGRRGYSVAEDHYIVEWNVEEAAEIRYL